LAPVLQDVQQHSQPLEMVHQSQLSQKQPSRAMPQLIGHKEVLLSLGMTQNHSERISSRQVPVKLSQKLLMLL
jgi:hypothetical protein